MKKPSKRLIPKTHCIEIFMWRDPDHKNLLKWSEFKPGMSSFSTGAGSLTSAMKIVRINLESGYTHFVLSYPVAMQGGPTEDNPHDHPMY
jgi:hypothetical protein